MESCSLTIEAVGEHAADVPRRTRAALIHSSADLAVAYAGVSDAGSAFAWLDKAIQTVWFTHSFEDELRL